MAPPSPTREESKTHVRLPAVRQEYGVMILKVETSVGVNMVVSIHLRGRVYRVVGPTDSDAWLQGQLAEKFLRRVRP